MTVTISVRAIPTAISRTRETPLKIFKDCRANNSYGTIRKLPSFSDVSIAVPEAKITNEWKNILPKNAGKNQRRLPH